jgi:hypothetical protein
MTLIVKRPDLHSNIRSLRWHLAAIVATGLLSAGAHAELGGAPTTVQTDARALSGAITVEHAANFDRHQITQADGSVVREYVSPRGTVFAVAWSGRTTPDLKTLLGAHYATYIAALAKQRPSHHVLTVTTPDLVVTIVRYQHTGSGSASLPAEVPAGVTVGELK